MNTHSAGRHHLRVLHGGLPFGHRSRQLRADFSIIGAGSRLTGGLSRQSPAISQNSCANTNSSACRCSPVLLFYYSPVRRKRGPGQLAWDVCSRCLVQGCRPRALVSPARQRSMHRPNCSTCRCFLEARVLLISGLVEPRWQSRLRSSYTLSMRLKQLRTAIWLGRSLFACGSESPGSGPPAADLPDALPEWHDGRTGRGWPARRARPRVSMTGAGRR
jgi:hypothetical protein